MRRSNKVFIFLLIAGIFFLSGWWLKLRMDIADLDNRLEDVRVEIQHMEEENKQLQNIMEEKINDPFFREKLAREKLGLAKKGETVYRIVPVD
ncbi:septum formation initiator family protein [Candidatus Aerophobetes bacterium]|nr:septum formation initiator family protein [Candidatus Aerophobetes bacterium]